MPHVWDPRGLLASPVRLSALASSELMGRAAREVLEPQIQLARRALPGVIVMASAITADEEVVVGAGPPGEDSLSATAFPMTHSLGKHVVVDDAPLVVEDAAADPPACHRRAVEELGVGAYAGFPLRSPDGRVLGAVCGVRRQAHPWSTDELQVLKVLTTTVEFAVAMMTAAQHRRSADRGAVPADGLVRVQHGLRTPLTTLLGFLDLLVDGRLGELGDSQRHALERCRAGALRLRDAVDALADATDPDPDGRPPDGPPDDPPDDSASDRPADRPHTEELER